MNIPNIYEGDYRRLMVFPAILLLISLYFIPHIKLGVDFTGGTLIVLDLNRSIDAAELQANLQKDGLSSTVTTYNSSFGPKAEIELGQNPDLVKADSLRDQFNEKLDQVAVLESQSNTNSSYMGEYLQERRNLDNISNSLFALAGDDASAESIGNLNELSSQALGAYRAVYDNYKNSISASIDKYADYSSLSVQSVSPALSAHFIENAVRVSFLAAILSTVFVFIFFRTLVPSLAVITGAVCDVVIAMGAMGMFGIPLTLASFAALLMLLGFSLDTDILLTMRMLKRAGNPREKAFDAMKTGMTMSVTALFAFLTLLLVGTYTHISIYAEISAVALAGLFGDLFATWGINAVTLLLHTEGKL